MRISSVSLIPGLALGIFAVNVVSVEIPGAEPTGHILAGEPNRPPPQTSTEHVSVSLSGKFQWQIWGKCSEQEKNTIKQAWADSKLFSDALNSWQPKGSFQLAVDIYMGTRSTSQDIFGRDYPKTIRGMFSGQVQNFSKFAQSIEARSVGLQNQGSSSSFKNLVRDLATTDLMGALHS